MNKIVPHQSNDDLIVQFCNWAELEVLDHRGQPMRPVIYFLESVMDETSRSSAKQYWKNIKRGMNTAEYQMGSNLTPLKVLARDGKRRTMDCATVVGLKLILMFIRDTKPHILRMAMAGTSNEKLRFMAQNLFEGRGAYENQFYLPKQSSFLDDDPFTDMGYNS